MVRGIVSGGDGFSNGLRKAKLPNFFNLVFRKVTDT
jgi:hypothetical protein